MSKRLLMLDCDGTLMDTIDAWHEAERMIASEAGAELTKEERDELNKMTLEEVGAFFHERYSLGSSVDAVIRRINDFMLEFYRTKSEANPGALDFVKTARERGFVLYVLSSSPQAFLQAGLARGGFLSYLDEILSVEDLGLTKRDPSTYRLVCERAGVSPSCAWLFDDSWYALDAARQAGCGAVGVYSTDWCGTHDELARFGDPVIDSFADIDWNAWLDRLSATELGERPEGLCE